MIKKTLFATICVIMAGCALKINTMVPKPNVNIPSSTKTLALSLDQSIQDNFTVPPSGGVKSAEVMGWHQSLKTGFQNAFGDAYKVVDDPGTADLVLKLKRADIGFALTSRAVNRYGDTVGSTAASQITYSAQLTDKQGHDLGRSSNTAVSKKSFTAASQATESVGNAVESMYEAIAADLFKVAN